MDIYAKYPDYCHLAHAEKLGQWDIALALANMDGSDENAQVTPLVMAMHDELANAFEDGQLAVIDCPEQQSGASLEQHSGATAA